MKEKGISSFAGASYHLATTFTPLAKGGRAESGRSSDAETSGPQVGLDSLSLSAQAQAITSQAESGPPAFSSYLADLSDSADSDGDGGDAGEGSAAGGASGDSAADSSAGSAGANGAAAPAFLMADGSCAVSVAVGDGGDGDGGGDAGD